MRDLRWCPGEDSNLDSKSVRNQMLGAVGLFELPRTLPMPMARWGGTAWYRLGAREIDRTTKQRAPRRPVSPAFIRAGSQFFAQRRRTV